MHTDRRNAIIVGVLVVIASVSAIIGVLLYDPIITGPNDRVEGAEHENQVIFGALSESILVCAAIGTATVCFRT